MRLGRETVGALPGALIGFASAYAGYKLGLGDLANPRSGFLPFWAGLFVGAISLWLVAKDLLGSQAEGVAELWAGTQWKRALIIPASALAYAVVLKPVGFVLSTAVLLFVVSLVLNARRWKLALAIALLGTAASYLLFVKLLGLRLAVGILG